MQLKLGIENDKDHEKKKGSFVLIVPKRSPFLVKEVSGTVGRDV